MIFNEILEKDQQNFRKLNINFEIFISYHLNREIINIENINKPFPILNNLIRLTLDFIAFTLLTYKMYIELL